MNEDFTLIELEQNGRKARFRVGNFEPNMGDYLVGEEGVLHKIETTGHRSTQDGRMLYIETSAEPGILRRVHPEMKFAKLVK